MCIHPSKAATAAVSGTTKGYNVTRSHTEKDRGPLFPRLKIAMIVYLGIVHVLGMVGLSLMLTNQASGVQLLWCFLTYVISGLGITAGAHRLWAHKSYKASPGLKAILLFFNSISNQGTLFHWARDHRVHHKFSEMDSDPHNANRGFFFAHIGWLMVDKDPEVAQAGKMLDLSDLKADPFVQIQERFNPVWNLFFCFVFPALIPFAWNDSDFMTNFWLGCSRYLLSLHFTWSVNSFAHFFGGHPYDEKSNPAENPMVSLVSLGEGLHNWHHKYPFDYAASELGISQQFNPTKLFIDFFAKFGMAYDRRRMTNLWAKREAMLLKEKPDHRSYVRGPTMWKRRYIEPESNMQVDYTQ